MFRESIQCVPRDKLTFSNLIPWGGQYTSWRCQSWNSFSFILGGHMAGLHPFTKSKENGRGFSLDLTALHSGKRQVPISLNFYKQSGQYAFVGFPRFQRTTCTRFWEGIQWMFMSKQYHPLCRHSPNLVTFHHAVVSLPHGQVSWKIYSVSS